AAGLSGRAQAALRWLLPPGWGICEADRQPADHARRDEARHAAPHPDAILSQAAGQPDRPPGRGCHGSDHQWFDEGSASGMKAPGAVDLKRTNSVNRLTVGQETA